MEKEKCMTLGIGAYRLPNGSIHLKRTSVLNRACDNLEQSGNFTVKKLISIDTAREILGQFGIAAKKANQILPKTGTIDYCAAHGSAQLSSEGKEIYSMVKSLKRPISTFLWGNLTSITKKLIR